MKLCKKCNTEKEENQFNKKGENGLSSYCKECNLEYLKLHYLNNKEYYAIKRGDNQKRVKEKRENYKKSLSCIDCGYSFKDHPNVCDFHHIENNKEFSPGIAGQSWKKYLREVKKCIPLCANCHRIRHSR